MKREYCIFVYATKQKRADGDMEYTVDADTIEEAGEIGNQELDEGMYCASIYRRPGGAAPMEFVEAMLQPIAATAA